MMKKIAIQGIESSFHEEAAYKYFGNNIETVKCLSFQDLCDSLKNGNSDYAVMAIENSIAGSLLQNYTLLQEYNFNIIGEIFLRIKMNLMVLPGTKIDDIKIAQSHPIAIRQCSKFLTGLKDVLLEEKEDTAICAKNIAEKKLSNVAAVASESAAEIFGLEILAKSIETNKKNFTRFIILSKTPEKDVLKNKATLFFQLPHDPGALAKILNILAAYSINLTKIQSVPIVGKPYEYNFHVDMIWETYSNYQKAIETIKGISVNLQILGEYKKGIVDFKNEK
ncbi:MAG: prephenate dehydratase [Flavobacteriales bacterium]|nr:prephenate dehydratase [Flavobacteriales bacterium]